MPTTKAYHRFKERCSYYEVDLQLCDLLVRDFCAVADSNQSLAVALGSNLQTHPNLRQRNTQMTRNIRGGHLLKTLRASYVKDIYEDFVEFLAETMTRAAQKGISPGRFAGNMKLDLQATELLQAGNWDDLVALISQKIFRSLESERKTMTLISKSATRLGLNLSQQLIDSAMPYFDARHMLVHQDGKADAVYRQKYPAIGVQNGKIRIDGSFVRNAHAAIDALAREIDAKAIAADLVKPEHMHGG